MELAVRHLRDGGLLVHPTTGVYGIGGGPDPALDREVTRLKERTDGRGLVRLGADAAALRQAFPNSEWPPLARRLAEAFWPGPLTLVLDDGSEHGVALRVEEHPFTRAVLEAFGEPLASTSLNRTGEPPAAAPAAARRTLRAFPEARWPVLFVEAGRLPGPPPSTMIRVPGREAAWDVLRVGRITPERIERTAGENADVEPPTERGP